MARAPVADQLAKALSAQGNTRMGKRAVVLKQLAQIVCLEHLTACLAACERPGVIFRLAIDGLAAALAPTN